MPNSDASNRGKSTDASRTNNTKKKGTPGSKSNYSESKATGDSGNTSRSNDPKSLEVVSVFKGNLTEPSTTTATELTLNDGKKESNSLDLVAAEESTISKDRKAKEPKRRLAIAQNIRPQPKQIEKPVKPHRPSGKAFILPTKDEVEESSSSEADTSSEEGTSSEGKSSSEEETSSDDEKKEAKLHRKQRMFMQNFRQHQPRYHKNSYSDQQQMHQHHHHNMHHQQEPQQQLEPQMAKVGMIPMQSMAFDAPNVPLLSSSQRTESSDSSSEDESEDVEEGLEDGLEFSYKPQAKGRTEVTFTIEPKRQPWLTMMKFGFRPVVNCTAPPCYLTPSNNPGININGNNGANIVNNAYNSQYQPQLPTLNQLVTSFGQKNSSEYYSSESVKQKQRRKKTGHAPSVDKHSSSYIASTSTSSTF